MFIQYINKLPSKIEFFDMLRTLDSSKVNISELDLELSETITAVCAYNGDRIIGNGIIKEGVMLMYTYTFFYYIKNRFGFILFYHQL